MLELENKFSDINKRFCQEFGENVVKIKKCDWGNFPFVLRFEDDSPSPEILEKAKRIANEYFRFGVDWHDDDSRIVDE